MLADLAVLLVILVTTGAVSWWSWQTLQDQRVQLGAEQELRAGGPEVRSLTGDLVRRHEAPGGAPPSRAEVRPDVERRDEVSAPAAAGGGISVDGRILAGLVITVACSAAAAGSWLVLQRSRRAAAAAGSQHCAVVPPTDTDTDTDTDADTDSAAVSDVQLAAPPDADVAAEAPGPLGTLLVPQRQPGRDEELFGSDRRASPAPDSAAPAVQHDRDDLLIPAGERPPVDEAFPAGPSGYGLATDVVARQRLYDGRVSRTQTYVQPGWLWWAGLNAPVTVRELSGTGLTCVLSLSSGPAAAQPPALGEHVRISFPVAGSTVKAGVRVQEKDTTAQTTELGLAFVDLLPDDADLLRTLLDGAG